jgi:hypothetical protein
LRAYEKDRRAIEEWASGFETLYKDPDSRRSPEEFWNAAMAHISGIGEAIRRTDYRELLECAAHAFNWFLCFVKKCNSTEDFLFQIRNNFSEIVGLKYPRKCGHCEDDRCSCNPVEMDNKKDKSAKYINLYNEWRKIKFIDYSLNDWLEDFWKIYSPDFRHYPRAGHLND